MKEYTIHFNIGRDKNITVLAPNPVIRLKFGAILKKIANIGRPMETEITQEVSKCASI